MRADHENAKPFSFAGGRTGVLLLHGFTGSPGHLRPLGEALRPAGYTIHAPLLPGHGTTLEDMNRCSWRDWLAFARTEYAALRESCDTVVVAGLSMGGTLAALLAEEYPVDGLLLYSPCMRMRQKTAPFAKAAALVKPYVRWPEEHRGSQEPDYDELRQYNCGYSGIPVAKAYDLYRLVTRANLSLFAVTAPVLVFQGRLDTTIDPQGAPHVIKSVSSEEKELVWLEKSRHLCTIGPEREELFARTLAFLEHIRQAQ